MKTTQLLSTALLFLFSLPTMASECSKPWVCETLDLSVPYSNLLKETKTAKVKIRAGYFPHKGSLKGNILYFEGLGDSMMNHSPLFNKLSLAGYRILAFDYMGQGGSEGKMNNTRIKSIPLIGAQVWKKFTKANDPGKKTIIGWSTGGLAAYMVATKKLVDQVILIAPGITPNAIVGEGLTSWPINEISMESLTTDNYASSATDPHLDPIKPASPLLVPEFAIDLLATAHEARKTSVPSSVKGLVLLSGEEDTYVSAKKAKVALKKIAPHFKVIEYAGALHEIDNERKEIREKAHQDILNFLK